MAKFTCPFCIREYNKNEVLYACPDCGESSKPKFGEREPVKCKHFGCGGLATQRKCLGCGQEIPKMALETSNLPFSIVGVATSGKTNYITVMLQELGKAAELKLALGAQTRDTSRHQKENRDLIYEDRMPAKGTEGGYNLPQIWYVRNLSKKSRNNVPTYTFTIFDGAGEDHENHLDTTSTVCRYINASKAIVLTIDPLVLSQIRHGGAIKPEVMRNSLGGYEGVTKNAEDVINSVAAYIKAARGIKSTKMLDIPVAVVLTKFDTLLSHKGFAPDALIKSPSLTIRNGKVDMTEIMQIHEEIQNWLYNIEEGSFVNALQSHFKDFYFFGVSSFGAPPEAGQKLPNNIRPHRVLDPILWLFKKAKFID